MTDKETPIDRFDSYHCGNGCSFYVFETGEQIERCSYFFIVS